jgi:hypothetical protein
MWVFVATVITAGCSGFVNVPGPSWNTVSVADRESIDRGDASAVASAQLEVHVASTALQAAQASVLAPRATTVDSADQQAALTRVARANDAERRARVAWCEARLDSATAHLASARANREFNRARAVDNATTGDDEYDVTPFRVQAGIAEIEYARREARTNEARTRLTWAVADVASQKEAYAQLMRAAVPINLADHLHLETWSELGRHPHHLRHGTSIASGR